ncbi:restriction endonuclease subunit S [Ectothiorhodospira mobilis]|uniref:restriction endonuclease subunit S n=1 Tax=Ectothiorhodospira mobilis TaxID=195064 RepID=UPI0019084074|nr:restriction endonuclease subunit S [Ectothiorhodospira mobilis]MBK1692393.1 hypothetical protein [Ectothiorhodospira mobilis]
MTVSTNGPAGADEQARRWKKRKIKFVSDVRTSNVDKHIVEDETAVRLCNYTDVYYHEKISPDMPFMQGSATESEIERFGLKKGQVLLTKDSESWEDIAVPAYVAETIPEVVCGYHLAVIEPDSDEVDGRFLSWLAQSPVLNDQFKLAAKGVTRFGLSQYALKNAVVELPPLEYQLKVATFLDRKTAEIDTLIAKKRRLLDLLAEKRTALITRAVTKGLDPDAPMKDSGIEWLGEIPAHWETGIPINYLVKMSGGMTPSTSNPMYWDGDIPWVSPKDMKRPELFDSQDHVTELALSETGLSLVEPGSVLIVVRGMILAHSFPVAINRVPVVLNQDMKALKVGPRLSSEYFVFLLRAIADVMLSLVETSAHGTKTLRTDRWKELVIALPSVDEQKAIVELVKKMVADLNSLEETTSRTIEKLEEYRSALITNAVTGQIQVA